MPSYVTTTTLQQPDGQTQEVHRSVTPAGQQTILVPGGAGYIGSHTVRQLVREGFRVVVVDSLINGKAQAVDPAATFEQVDLADKEALGAVFAKHKPVAVIDFVAFLAVGESQADPLMYMQNNVVNFVNLLDCMVASGCKFLIKSSTSSSYGDPPDAAEIPLKEDYQSRYKPAESALGKGTANFPGGDDAELEGEAFFKAFLAYYHSLYSERPELSLEGELTRLRIPMSIYGLTKLMDECLMAKFEAAHGIKWMALRYFNVCGAAEEGDIGEDKARPSTLMTMVIYHLLGKRPALKIFGTDYETHDGTAIRDYIHPSDLATGHLAALRRLQETLVSDVFNLGNGKGNTVLEVMEAMEAASGLTVPPPPPPGHTHHARQMREVCG